MSFTPDGSKLFVTSQGGNFVACHAVEEGRLPAWPEDSPQESSVATLI